MTVMPVTARGPLAGTVMDQLAAWIAAEGYAPTMGPQIVGVARGLSAWMDDRQVRLDALCADDVEEFESAYPLGVPGHHLVRMRVPALRRFLIESGHLRGARPVRKRPRRPGHRRVHPFDPAAERELDEWARWQREVRGMHRSPQTVGRRVRRLLGR